MRRAPAVLVLILGVACDPEAAKHSCSVPTDAISLVATVVENGPTLRAEVEFSTETASGTRSLSLCDKDSILIAGDAAEEVERHDGVLYAHTSEMTDERSLGFEFQREEETSVTFTIELPPAFEVTAPTIGAEISRSADFMLEWTPANAGALMRIELAEEIGNGVCLQTPVAEQNYKGLSGVDVDDDGNWKIPAEVIDSGARDECDASYRFSRLVKAEYPAELATGGYLEGRVERLIAFVSVP